MSPSPTSHPHDKAAPGHGKPANFVVAAIRISARGFGEFDGFEDVEGLRGKGGLQGFPLSASINPVAGSPIISVSRLHSERLIFRFM